LFYSSISENGNTVYALNRNYRQSAIISVPGDDEQSGLTYVIPPNKKIEFSEAYSPNISPMTNITTGLACFNDDQTSDSQNPIIKDSLVRLSFKGLKLGSSVQIGSFKLTCNTRQLLIISTTISINCAYYWHLESTSGSLVEGSGERKPQTDQAAENQNTENKEYHFDFGLETSAGMELQHNSINGCITLGIPDNQLANLSDKPSLDLSPEEKGYFMGRGLLKN
jgi:hypothetical protein